MKNQGVRAPIPRFLAGYGCRVGGKCVITEQAVGHTVDKPPSRGSAILTESQWYHLSLTLELSKREHEVMQLLFDAMSKKEIAAHLCISPHTVHTYLVRLYRKLGVKNRSELLVLAFAKHLEYIATQCTVGS